MKHSDEDSVIFGLLFEQGPMDPTSRDESGDSENITVNLSNMQQQLNQFTADMLDPLHQVLERYARTSGGNKHAKNMALLQAIRAVSADLEDGDAALAAPFLGYTPNRLTLEDAVELATQHPNIVFDNKEQNWLESSRNVDDTVTIRDDSSNTRKVRVLQVSDIQL